jgi:hypothetical protein
MDPLFKSLIVQLAPQPLRMPLPPLDHEDLQAIFSAVVKKHPYQALAFTPDGRGAIFQNGPEDAIELRPAQFQMQMQLDGPEPLGAAGAEQKVSAILEIATERLKIENFLQCAVQIIAFAPLEGDDPDAKAYVAEHLMHGTDQAAVLDDGYFAGGVRFRKIQEDNTGEDSLSVEPYLQDNHLVYVDYQRARVAVHGPIQLEQLSTWIVESFEFLSGPTMDLLSQEGNK